MGWSPWEWDLCPYERGSGEFPSAFHCVWTQKNMTVLASWSQTSCLYICQKQLSVVSKLHSLWYFNIAA